MPTPESWYADAATILEREQRQPPLAEPVVPSRCLSGECGTCDDCIDYAERMAGDYPVPSGWSAW